MKGGIACYLLGHESAVPRLLDACAGASITLAHHTTGRVTYLDDRAGCEGDQVEVDERELVKLLHHRLVSRSELTVQFWTDPDHDLVCVAAGQAWDAYCFWFDLMATHRVRAWTWHAGCFGRERAWTTSRSCGS